MTYEEVINAKRKYEKNLRKHPYVKGVGVGYKKVGGKGTDQLSIVITVSKKQPKNLLTSKDLIPKTLGNIETDVVEIGFPRALISRTAKYRPSPCGVSIGHYAITAGTQGAVVKDSEGKLYILSNNHVLANENNCSVGDEILQPGPYDGGKSPADVIAKLERWIALEGQVSTCPVAKVWASLYNISNRLIGGKTELHAYADGNNEVDCAIAKPVDENDLDSLILDIGKPKGAKDPELDMVCKKSGRTTELTTDGPISLLDWSGDIGYSNGNLHFVGQGIIIKDNFCAGGDSGSVILNQADDKVVGLLFAGSDNSTIFSPIRKVLDALEVEIVI